jgi:hypothetical protein
MAEVIPFTPRTADPSPPRCWRCSGIVATEFRGQALPQGVGYCPTHNVVRIYRGDRKRPW